MKQYTQITKLNDFVFCPMSLYFHSVYDDFGTVLYHSFSQKNGKIRHKNIDEGVYSTAKRYIQAMPVYSKKYNLVGKIDVYDSKTKTLIERKARVKKIYDGYKYQLYAQYYCMLEMGYDIKYLKVHSLEDNKRYDIPLPDEDEKAKFEKLVEEVKKYKMKNDKTEPNQKKCKRCIYNNLCPFAKSDV